MVAPFVNVLNSLRSSPTTAGVLRVGGNSQDGYQWNPTGSTTANSLFSGTINSGMVDALLEAARRTGRKVILGLNLRNDDPAMATALARYAISQDTGHNRRSFYTPFVICNGQASPRPNFYGLALFKYAVGRRFCAVSTSNATGQLVRTWAVLDTGTNRIYAYAINKGGTGKAGTASVTAPTGHSGTAFINVMRSTGCLGKTTTIEGATLPANGVFTWAGRPVNPVSGTRRYEFSLPECATALLSIP